MRMRLKLILIAVVALAATPLHAQSYPSRPIKIIVSSSPGSFPDLVARTLGAQLSERLGQPVPVEDKTGAAGQLATDTVAKSAPDGYTLLVCTPGPVTVAPHASKLPYDPLTDFTPVALLATVGTGFAVNPSLPVHNFREFLAYAKAHPGELSYSHSGTGSLMHLGGENLKLMTGINMVGVPYRGAMLSGTAIAAGEVQVGFADIPTLMRLSQDNKVRVIAVVDPARSTFAPDVPTVAESGLPGYDAGGWAMLLAPARTPAAVVTLINGEAKRAFGLPEVRQTLLKASIEPGVTSPEETGRLLRADYEKWGRVVRDAGIKLD
jgi:tripartite-type tricarboxylate transporter receptor subunit TctC